MASGKRKRKPIADDVGGFPEKSHRSTFGRQVWICKPVAFQLSFGQNLPDQLKPRCKIAKARILEPNGWTFLQERPPTLLGRARIPGDASIRSRSASGTHPLYSRGDLVILFLRLGLGGARPRDCSFHLGRLLFDGRLVVFLATGQPQEAKAQQSKAQSTCDHPHDEYDSTQKRA
jgi:hypothetical protein